MTHGVIEADSVAVRRVLRAISKAPGCSTQQIAWECGWSPSHTQKVLAVARAGGGVQCVRQAGNVGGWYMEWQAEDAREAEAKRRAELKRERNIRYEANKADPEDSADDQPIQRRVSEWGALPFDVSAPNFVFTWRPAA